MPDMLFLVATMYFIIKESAHGRSNSCVESIGIGFAEGVNVATETESIVIGAMLFLLTCRQLQVKQLQNSNIANKRINNFSGNFVL